MHMPSTCFPKASMDKNSKYHLSKLVLVAARLVMVFCAEYYDPSPTNAVIPSYVLELLFKSTCFEAFLIQGRQGCLGT